MARPKAAKTSPSKVLIKDLLDILGRMQKSITDSEKTHEAFKEKLYHENRWLEREGHSRVAYYRFNLPAQPATDISKIQLDEWQPRRDKRSFAGEEIKAGALTKIKMEAAFQNWIGPDEQGNESPHLRHLRDCAELLVARRRSRADHPHWERFAYNTHYECPERHICAARHRFHDREDLRKHAVLMHGVVSKQATGHYDCYCSPDGIGHSDHQRFSSLNDFKAHLCSLHNLNQPRILGSEEVERWIDGGRRFPDTPAA